MISFNRLRNNRALSNTIDIAYYGLFFFLIKLNLGKLYPLINLDGDDLVSKIFRFLLWGIIISLAMIIFFGVVPKILGGTPGQKLTKIKVISLYGELTVIRFYLREYLFKHFIYGPLYYLPFAIFLNQFSAYWFLFVLSLIGLLVDMYVFKRTKNSMRNNLLFTKVKYS